MIACLDDPPVFVWYMTLLPLFLPFKMYCVYMFVAVVVDLLSNVVVNLYETKDKFPHCGQ